MSPVRRKINAAKLAAKTRPYWWWVGASVDELTDRLVEARNIGPGTRLEVHIDAHQHAAFVVVPPGTMEASPRDPIRPPINESFVCPPRCP